MKSEYSVIIVGTGAAGLFSALCLPKSEDVLMITKDELSNSDSYLAQGGISVLKDDEDYETYLEDTLRAGRYENDRNSVNVMIRESREIIKDLIGHGVEFDYDEEGNLSYTREGGHSIFRILHHKDVTGKEITEKLIRAVQRRENITICTYTTMIDVLEKENVCKGIIAEDREGNLQAFYSKAVILATGGLGGLFAHSTNFGHISGDGFAVALRHQIQLKDLPYIQIHPTTLYSKQEGRSFLISESVRGEGAVLLNEHGERFVDELKPRDIVTAAIRAEMEKDGTEFVYLNLRGMSREKAKERFPAIYKRCEEEGYDLSKDLIPVTPAQHYLMGGIKTDDCGKTSMHFLYAVGETACNGVHGANRLASNSLLESLVFAKRASGKIAEEVPAVTVEKIPVFMGNYKHAQEQEDANKALVLAKIKQEDQIFYDKWCNDAG